ncbi:hypothetical protein [Flavobacterium sp.]|uniref:hypothetical protein n=1 Tax=Flavobacterium sp. TaxID=239 RepID=UPI00391B0FD0
MNTTKIIGTILIILGIGLGYLGFNKISESTNSVNVLGVKIEASNESGKQEGYLYIGLAIVLFVGGVYSLNRSK